MKRVAISALMLAALAGCATNSDLEATRRQIDQVNQQASSRLSEMESKLSNDKLLDLVSQVDALKAEIAKLRGENEVINYTLQTTQKRQNDLYADLDARLGKVEGAAASAPAASQPPAAAQGTAQAAPDFDKALKLLRSQDFANAVPALQRFISQNPDSPQAVEATYWLGVAHAGLRQYDSAIDIHRRFVEQHPDDPRAPDALRSIGLCQRALNQLDTARATFRRLIKLYPKSPAAIKAKEQLKTL
ncbi:tol-pal system protein YbgF [Paludibacterium paludis]|uniref:Cell division coordinator CpoB n=1 Tax=Paludibacterium paludis TaxID=1225769 RepID=A0A918U8M5_9NEIS|nr:tol-pal system protein YbgF [Paludibacterium paludis]GGY09641.1 tol-pal system protein YbgF [Paludibacterium paludis]